jgi:aromatic-L-amino-acid decarboxylase
VSHVVNHRDGLLTAAHRAATFLDERRASPVAPAVSAPELRAQLDRYDFSMPLPLTEVIDEVFTLLGQAAVRSDHPRYFGLFNPPALPAGIVGDLIAATVNPQLAVWSHAPAAAEIERKVLQWFGGRIGWLPHATAGTFTTGGTEANHTAVLAALAKRYPDWATRGVGATVGRRPTIFASSEAHLAWIKIARSAGLGSDAVHLVPAGAGMRLNADALDEAIRQNPDLEPLIVVATAGTTAHGAIDDLTGLASVARHHGAHFHVDAAWAGGGLVNAEVRRLLAGIELADSVTIDPHKWLSVPMGAGMYLTRDWTALQTAFSVQTSYMPSASVEHRDAYIHSLQWSRRFIGLKLFMSLATIGEQGYAAIIDRQLALGRSLREQLVARGWSVLNDTALPLVCFTPDAPDLRTDRTVRAIEAYVAASGVAWLSSVALGGHLVLRACITSYETTVDDVEDLLAVLDAARVHGPDLVGGECRTDSP